MKKKTSNYLLLVLIFWLQWACSPEQGKVYFLPSLHNLHSSNNNYSYDSLRQIINRLHPDIIAVEIRQIDINQDSSYLKSNYPYEMWMMKYWFPEVTIVGFDWLGDDIEGKQLPEAYWKEIAPIKQFENALNADSLYTLKCARCAPFSHQRLAILKKLSLHDILNSDDALLTRQYYACLAEQLEGSTHERILVFYRERDQRLLANIKGIINRYKRKKIVIITGDDHFIYLKDKFPSDPIYK